MSLISLRGAEPIAGYSVTERLGAGGYGEVWKAEAPGGLQKAIKFIYGYLNEDKASRELKALNRVKQIRHPFLLSLERIEVVDGQLLIVTELADTSVKDRCQECRDEGLPGIPRAELLNHLRDAADALDFLSASGLQHLDVKPENLLLVGGRVKVADFGLVKDIQDRNVSQMGGMTPAYAPPEIFDGRPNAHSDQYSLAIVYQEMLTGVLPFPGATAAQLATQHMNSRPRLESLPPADRPVIARALAKKAGERFPSSRAMIDALLCAGLETATGFHADATPGQRPASGDTTFASSQDTDHPAAPRGRMSRRTPSGRVEPRAVQGAAPRNGSLSKASAGPAEVRDLPPLEIKPEEVGLRPTLYLGIGGTAAHVLKRLRRRLHERFGDRSATPVLQMLLIDTDSQGLSRQSTASEQGGLDPSELLAMPLRRPEDYRPDATNILQWLSRRWLYNIPRSLQTEGLRPLGRLAMVDHATELFDRIRDALERCLSGEALAAAEKNTGLPIRDRTPRVFIIASLSGGTGSGMVLDVGYAVRMLLAEMGVPNHSVCGLLAHSTSRAGQGKDLATANSYACLSELEHYGNGGYPGEPACGIRAFEGVRAPFPTAYFVPLGERLSDDQYLQAIDGLAEYLYLDAATLGGLLLDKCRATDNDPDQPLQLRTMGICRLGCQQGLAAKVAEHLCGQILARWTGQREPGPEQQTQSRERRLKQLASEVVSEFELESDSLLTRYRETVEKCVEPSSQAVLDQVVREFLELSLRDPNLPADARWQQLTKQIESVWGSIENSDACSSPRINLKQLLEGHRTAHVKEVDRGVVERIVTAADDTEVRLAGAQKIADLLLGYLRGLDQELASKLQALQGQTTAHGQAAPRLPLATGRKAAKEPAIVPVSGWHEYLVAHGRLALDQWAMYSTRRLVQSLIAKGQSVAESLIGLRRDAERLGKQFEAKSPWTACATPSQESDEENIDRAILRELESRFEGLAAQFEKTTNQDVLAQRGGLVRMLSAGEEVFKTLPGVLRAAARWEIVQALKEIDVVRLVLGPLNDESTACDRLDRFISAAWPELLACGGAKRLLLLMPPCSTAEQVQQMVAEHRKETPSVLFAPGGELVACYEGEQIPLADAAAFLVRDDPQFATVASRLHTRTDIEWRSF